MSQVILGLRQITATMQFFWFVLVLNVGVFLLIRHPSEAYIFNIRCLSGSSLRGSVSALIGRLLL